jgi:outer membrane autotransporter protein
VHSITTDRTATVAESDHLTANFTAQSVGGRIETGYRFLTPYARVTPYAAAQVQDFFTPNYSENATSGSNTFALSYNSRSSVTTRTELGAWFDKALTSEQGRTLSLRLRAAWANDHSSDQGINAAFQTLPGATFTVNGAAPATNLALVTTGAELQLANNVSFGLKFDGEFADVSQTYAGTGTVRYVW